MVLRNKLSGLTLIEVLVALAIISIAFTAILIANSQHLRNTSYLEKKMTATWVASNVLNQITAGIMTIPADPIETNMLDKQWLVQVAQQPATGSIKKISVSVRDAREHPTLITLVSYV